MGVCRIFVRRPVIDKRYEVVGDNILNAVDGRSDAPNGNVGRGRCRLVGVGLPA
jgi:hypothetical protein